jgi:predicted MFS family arabinose efflux permease
MSTRRPWLSVVVSACGLAVGQGPINVFAAGVFIKPIADALQLGRGSVSTAIAASSLVTAIAAPFFGRALDDWGVRRPLLVSIALFGATTAAFGLVSSLTGLFLLYALSGLVGVGQNPTAYSKVLAAYFDRRRGLAMGLALAGVGLGTALMPALSARLIIAIGWRATYVCLGVAIIVLAFVPVLCWLPEPARDRTRKDAGLPGVSFAEAVRSRTYWSLAIAFFLTTVTVNGALVHVVPLLTDRGMPAPAAAGTIGAAGMALIAGRVAAGYVIDRVFAPYVAMASLVGPMAGLAIIGWNAFSLSPFVGTALLGLGIGVEVDLMSFLVTRYFGLRAFGALHGLMFAALVLGNAAGASALGWSFQYLHSYQPGFVAFELLLLAAMVLFATLGPYRYPAGLLTGARAPSQPEQETTA